MLVNASNAGKDLTPHTRITLVPRRIRPTGRVQPLGGEAVAGYGGMIVAGPWPATLPGPQASSVWRLVYIRDFDGALERPVTILWSTPCRTRMRSYGFPTNA